MIAYNALTIKKPLTGIPNHVHHQLEALLKQDSSNKYIIFLRSTIDPSPFKKENAEVLQFKCGSAFMRIILEQLVIPFIVYRKKATTYFSTSFAIPFVLPFQKKVKMITNIYDLSYLKTPENMKLTSLLYYRLIFPHAIKHASLLIANSKAIAYEIQHHFKKPKNQIKTIYPALTLETKDTTDITDRICLPKDYILAIGRLEKRKNIINLLKAYLKLFKKLDAPPKLVIAGFKAVGANEIEKFITRARLKEHVIFPGHVEKSELVSLYQHALFFIYPSYYEGFGLPILEAFAAGTAVIASHASSIPEVAGDGALYIAPQDPEDIANKMLYLINSIERRDELISEGKRQLQNFSWEKHGEILLEVIKSL